jgi:hypothetical protein
MLWGQALACLFFLLKIFLILLVLLYRLSSGGAVMKAVTFNEALEVMTTGVAGGLLKPHRGSVTCTP